jgi:hypothetical protein
MSIYASDHIDNPFDLSKMRSPEDFPEIMKVLWSEDRLTTEIASRSHTILVLESTGKADPEIIKRLLAELDILVRFRETPTVKQRLESEASEESEKEKPAETSKKTLSRDKNDEDKKPVVRKLLRR